jgi:hypothetical protein
MNYPDSAQVNAQWNAGRATGIALVEQAHQVGVLPSPTAKTTTRAVAFSWTASDRQCEVSRTGHTVDGDRDE